MELRVLQQNENASDPLFQSEYAQQLLSIYAEYYVETGFQFPWVAYLIVDDGEVLGTVSFTKAPVDHTVEIAYWTSPDHEGKGVASFGCKEIVRIAVEADPSVTITAKTAPEINPSTHILEKNGFRKVEVVQDDEIGDAWMWKYHGSGAE
ncbi:hypothetical protein GCM10011318_00610 [Phaeocystidibacter marisrubri]|nr:hypothetical protein GCM10011318_00610 [Phaeocystidibacter marisrubri]